MRRKRTALAAVVVLCVLGLAGCSLVGPDAPRDLKFSSIAVVNGKDVIEDSWRGYDLRPNPELLRIEITTKYDFLRGPYEREYLVDRR
jgi:hypothetical protein